MTDLPKSKYSLNGKSLEQLSHAELLDAVETLWRAKNDEVLKVEAERDGYKKLLESGFPIHSLWRGAVENGYLLGLVALMVFLATHH